MDSSMVFARWRKYAPQPNTCFLGPTRVQIQNSIPIGSAVFAQLTAERPYRPTSQWAALPFRIAHYMGRSGLHLIHGSFGPPESSTQTVSRSVQPFCRDHYCDRPIDRQPYSICNNRPHSGPYVRSTSMRPQKTPRYQQ